MRSPVAVSLARELTLVILVAPIPVVATFIAIKLQFPQTYHALIQEDGILENLQFVFYAAAAVAGSLAATRFRLLEMRYRSAIWYVFAVAILLIAFEEVSWFERVTHFHIDSVVSRNLQKETTLHNLDTVQPYLVIAYIIVGAGGTLGWLLLPNALIFPDRILCLYFLPTLLLYSYFRVASLAAVYFNNEMFRVENFVVWRDQEPVETLLSLGFFLHACLTARYLKMLLAGKRRDR